jgi:hypothetical protein
LEEAFGQCIEIREVVWGMMTVARLREVGHDVKDVRGTLDQGLRDPGLWVPAIGQARMLITKRDVLVDQDLHPSIAGDLNWGNLFLGERGGIVERQAKMSSRVSDGYSPSSSSTVSLLASIRTI